MAEATFVLVGGEAHATQGVEPAKREFQHTSLEYVGDAYEILRAAGVPRRRIITIVQLRDYLDTLALGEKGNLLDATGVPPKWYTDQRRRTEARCRRLIDEGGASYDFEAVNPGTVWSVLLGEEKMTASGAASAAVLGPVVPPDETGAIVVGIYTHGNKHPAQAASGGGASLPAAGPETDEYFGHMPYANTTRPEMLDFVATEGAETAGSFANSPVHYLYCTQLRDIFHRIFRRTPRRPVVGLLNYCLSGGNLEFMRREAVRTHLGIDAWPLFLMSSSQANKDAVVGGIWDAWFQSLGEILQASAGTGAAVAGRSATPAAATTVIELYGLAEAAYYRNNLYEFLNAVKARVYVPAVFECAFSFPGAADDSVDPWHLDLKASLEAAIPQRGGSGQFSYAAVAELQRAYDSGDAFRVVRGATASQVESLKCIGGVAVDEPRRGQCVVWMRGRVRAADLRGMDAAPHPVRLVEYAGTQETGACRQLTKVVEAALGDIARPDEVHGVASGIASMAVVPLVRGS